MNERLAEAVGDLMLLLHTRTRGEPAPLLEAAVTRFATCLAQAGASRTATVALLQGLIDQAVASADLTDRSILRIVDELHDRPIALCVEAYDRVHKSVPETIEPATQSITGEAPAVSSGVTGSSALTGGGSVQLSFGFHAGIVTVRLGGTYPIEDGKAALVAVLPDPDVVRGTLVDLRDSHAFETRSPAELESVGEFLGELHELLGARVALLVQTDVAYGHGRAISAWAAVDGTPVEVFRSERNALAWLSNAPELMH